MNIHELAKEEFEKLTVYPGKYLHISSVTEEKVTYEGQTYLLTYSPNVGEMLAGKDTTIAHMVKYYDISETGTPVDSDTWKVSDGHTVLIKDHNRFTSQTLPAGTKYIVVRSAMELGDWVDPGTLAVCYPDVTYPSV